MSFWWAMQPGFAPRTRAGRRPTSGMRSTFWVCWWRVVFPPSGSRQPRTNNCGNCCCIAAACHPSDEDLSLGTPALVRLHTRVTNQLEGMAKNEGLLVPGGWSGKRRKGIEALSLPGWYGERRKDLLGLLDRLEERIAPLDKAVSQAAAENAEACLLMTHPGVGPVVSLAYVLTIGNWQRFQRGKQVGSYFGLIPAEESSGDKRRLGHISKQGNTLVRWLLVEAASTAQRYDPSWHRQYLRLSMTKHHGVAKVAIAHKLAVRLYWMLRSGEDYQHVRERGSTARQSECPGGRETTAD